MAKAEMVPASITPRSCAGLLNTLKKGALALMLIAIMPSCKKIQENKIIKGTWEVMKVELNGNDYNVMEVFLKDYVSNSECCHYIVDFRDDGTCSGTYHRNDSIIYVVEGVWEMKKFNLVYVKLDRYVNADLDVNRHSKTYYSLESEENAVSALNDTLPTKLEIKRLD